MNNSDALAMILAAKLLEDAKEEIKYLHTTLAVLADKAGGSLSFTAQELDEFFKKGLELRARKHGDLFEWVAQKKGEACNCPVCQGNKAVQDFVSDSRTKH